MGCGSPMVPGCQLGRSINSLSLCNGKSIPVAIFFELVSFEPETRKVLFGHKVRVDGSFVVGKEIDLVSVSFNLGNFCSSHESLQQKVKK